MNRDNLPSAQLLAPSGGPASRPTYIVDLAGVDQRSFRSWPKNDVVLGGLVLHAPLCVGSSTLGFGDPVWIDIVDSTGFRVTTHSVETVLQIIEHFEERECMSLLAGAAFHYGFDDAWTLIRGRHE
jgi:hypothetical protein